MLCSLWRPFGDNCSPLPKREICTKQSRINCTSVVEGQRTSAISAGLMREIGYSRTCHEQTIKLFPSKRGRRLAKYWLGNADLAELRHTASSEGRSGLQHLC
jgi:hypothetical protein